MNIPKFPEAIGMESPVFEKIKIELKHSRVHGLSFGKGSRVFFAFPGYGRPASDYESLWKGMGEDHRIIAFELPCQGPTEITEGHDLMPKDIADWVHEIADREKLNSFGVIGYSIGGRVVLSALPYLDGRCTELVLIAPDGLRPAVWNKWATNTTVGRMLFRFTIRYPGWLFGLSSLLGSVGLLKRPLRKFVKLHMDTRERRQFVYDVWWTLRQMQPDRKRAIRNIMARCIPCWFIFGKHDRIIPAHLGTPWAKEMGAYGRTLIVNEGHELLTEETGNAWRRLARIR